MVTAPEYRHVQTGTLAVLAQRLGTLLASPSTWYRLVRTFGWRRPRLRVHPAKSKIGLRTTRADEMWHIDKTVIRLLDGSRAYLHAVIDNFRAPDIRLELSLLCHRLCGLQHQPEFGVGVVNVELVEHGAQGSQDAVIARGRHAVQAHVLRPRVFLDT